MKPRPRKKKCSIAKNVNSAIKTVTGGAHAGSMAREILSLNPDVDFVIIGEAERTLLDLLRALETGSGYSDLDGIAFRQGDSATLIPKTKYIEDLDSVPFPARHLFDMRRYLEKGESHGYARQRPFTQVVTSRGCPCRCTFCCLDAHWGGRQRMRSARNVLDELEWIVKEYGVKEVHFEDENFTANKKRAIEICDGIIERGLDIRWHSAAGIAAYTLDEQLLDKMQASGCFSITLGIESGNQNVVTRLMNKPVNLKKIPVLVKQIRDRGMDVRGFFMIGYPGETKETIEQTIDYAKQLELDWVYISIFSPLPKTRIYDTCIDKHYIRKGDFDPVKCFHRGIVRTPEFDPEYLHALRDEAVMEMCFRNNPNLRKYNLDKAIDDFTDVVDRYPHFDFANFYLAEAYGKKGATEKAAEFYQKTLTANPSHKEAEQKLRELGYHQSSDQQVSPASSRRPEQDRADHSRDSANATEAV